MPRGDDAEMFDLAPVSLWLEDYSGLRTHFDGLRAHKVSRILRAYLREDRERATEPVSGAPFVVIGQPQNLEPVRSGRSRNSDARTSITFSATICSTPTVEELAQLWDGHSHFHEHERQLFPFWPPHRHSTEGLDPPGYENDWRRVLVAIERT